MTKMDVWNSLEQNWRDFFWFTGEIPPTVQLIVRDVETIYALPIRGRKPSLSIQNQVKFLKSVSLQKVL